MRSYCRRNAWRAAALILLLSDVAVGDGEGGGANYAGGGGSGAASDTAICTINVLCFGTVMTIR